MSWWYYCKAHGFLERAETFSGMYPPNVIEMEKLAEFNLIHHHNYPIVTKDTNSYYRKENCYVVLVFKDSLGNISEEVK